MSQEEQSPVSPLWRRLFAIIYDSILLFAVLYIATALILPFSGGTAIQSGNLFYGAYLLLCSYLYFVWQWVHGGQTLGMRAWRIRLCGAGGAAVTWRNASLRFLLSLLSWLPAGGGFLWALVNRRGLTLHDRFSHTRLQTYNRRP